MGGERVYGPSDLLSGCRARPPCFDIFSFSLCFLFSWPFPPAVLFLCLFGFPDVAATGYFGNYLGLTRYGEVVVGGRQWKTPVLGEGKFHICFSGWMMGWSHGLNIVTKTGWESQVRPSNFSLDVPHLHRPNNFSLDVPHLHREMAQSAKRSPCRHKDLSLVPKTHIKIWDLMVSTYCSSTG